VGEGIRTSESFYYNGDLMTVKKVDNKTGRILGQINFTHPGSYNNKYYTCFMPDESTFAWYSDSNSVYLFDMAGILKETLILDLQSQGTGYYLAPSAHASAKFDVSTQSFILPVLPYLADERMPRFVVFDKLNRKTSFVDIVLPVNYDVSRHLGSLAEPFTALDKSIFYVIYPLSDILYAYDLRSKSLSKNKLSLPVSLSSPGSLRESIDYLSAVNNEEKANRIVGFGVSAGKVYIQQTEGWSENLESKKYIDNTVLHTFTTGGNFLGSSAYPRQPFAESGVFHLDFVKDGNIYHFSHDKLNKRQYITLR
jgi:hypothetical protein